MDLKRRRGQQSAAAWLAMFAVLRLVVIMLLDGIKIGTQNEALINSDTTLRLVLPFSFVSAARSGKMRRRKLRKDQMLRFPHSMKKEYYNNTNGAEIVKSSYFDNAFELGDKVSFLCVARGEPVPRVSWFKDGQEFLAHEFSRVAEYRTKDGLIKSKLEIDPARQLDAGTYECHANNIYSVDRRQFKADF